MPAINLLAGKTAIITGGTTGIGRAIALEYIRQGCNVVVNHLGLASDAAHLESLISEAASLKALSPLEGLTIGTLDHIPGDVSHPTTGPALVARAVSLFGRLDICVSNAGICQFAEFLTLTGDLFSKTVRTNLDGAFYVVQAAARQMASQPPFPTTTTPSPFSAPAPSSYSPQVHRGSIIALSSISALVGGGEQTHYTPTKAGVLSLMQSCAVALGSHGIRCNALLPGTIRTQLNDEDLADDTKRAYMEGRIPLGRTGDPRDMAGPAVFLACDELSGYVTGAQLLVDGGLFVNLQ
ncbi:3-oxoacyl-reductase [Annulohypoxylon maeteangense]|uniref:3-oxoacyl-reductase n=1 Tax=Annulohypoxylon maeteangense TaxID=1927788 RepID=UPI00200787C8|nr:3-oxoacyl-reductase [Annulohypoxylon maeteangense]KAI0880677.1 3-oxoacyl-reductase [Annulohypoxylon maeteangense]